MTTALIDGDVLLHASMWGTASFEEAVNKLNYNLGEYTLNAFCEEEVIAVGPFDGKNYRDDLFPEYKQTASRVESRKTKSPYHDDVKAYLYSLPNTVEGDNIEADDLLGIWSNQLGDSCVIVTVDKDMKQLKGKHFNPKKEAFFVVNEFEADRFFLRQLITGDPMDRIPGLPSQGPAKADKVLAAFSDNKDLAKHILGMYYELIIVTGHG